MTYAAVYFTLNTLLLSYVIRGPCTCNSVVSRRTAQYKPRATLSTDITMLLKLTYQLTAQLSGQFAEPDLHVRHITQQVKGLNCTFRNSLGLTEMALYYNRFLLHREDRIQSKSILPRGSSMFYWFR